MIYIVIILFVIVAILIATNIRIISQSDAVVIERLGAYLKTWDPRAVKKMVYLPIDTQPYVDNLAEIYNDVKENLDKKYHYTIKNLMEDMVTKGVAQFFDGSEEG